MKLIINNLVIVVVTIVVVKLCTLSVCGDATFPEKSSSHDNHDHQESQNYAYSQPITNEPPEYNTQSNDRSINDVEVFCNESRAKLIGGGILVKIKENRQCKNNYIGLKRHPRNKQYYLICQRNKIVFGRCEDSMIFNDTYKYCVTENHNESKPKFNVAKCNASGIFPIDEKPRYYYTCVYLGGQFIQKICKCPRGTIFHSSTGTCIERVKSPAAPIKHITYFDSDERYKSTIVKVAPTYGTSYANQPCDMPESYTDADNFGYYYKCSLKSDGKYYQVKLKCPPGKTFDSSSEECVSNSDFDYFTEFPHHSISKIIRHKKRNFFKNLPRLLTSYQSRVAKRIELFNIENSDETEEDEAVQPIVNTNFCGCSDVNKYCNNKPDKKSVRTKNTRIIEMNSEIPLTVPTRKQFKPQYDSGSAEIETQDKSIGSTIECISKETKIKNRIYIHEVHGHQCHKNLDNATPSHTETKTLTSIPPTDFGDFQNQRTRSTVKYTMETITNPTSSTTLRSSSSKESNIEGIAPAEYELSTKITPNTLSSILTDNKFSHTTELQDPNTPTEPTSTNKTVTSDDKTTENLTSTTQEINLSVKTISDPTTRETKIVPTILSAPISNEPNGSSEYSYSYNFITSLLDLSNQQSTTREDYLTPSLTPHISVTSPPISEASEPDSKTLTTLVEATTPQNDLTSDDSLITLLMPAQQNPTSIPITASSEPGTTGLTTSMETRPDHSSTISEESTSFTALTFSQETFRSTTYPFQSESTSAITEQTTLSPQNFTTNETSDRPKSTTEPTTLKHEIVSSIFTTSVKPMTTVKNVNTSTIEPIMKHPTLSEESTSSTLSTTMITTTHSFQTNTTNTMAEDNISDSLDNNMFFSTTISDSSSNDQTNKISEESYSTTLSTTLLESDKLESTTSEKELISSPLTTKSDDPIISSFTASTEGPSIKHSTTPNEKSTIATIIQMKTNNSTIDNNTTMPWTTTSTSSILVDNKFPAINATSAPVNPDSTPKATFLEDTDLTRITSTIDIKTMNNTISRIINLIDAMQEATSIIPTAKQNKLSTEKLAIPEITTSEDIERDIVSYNESDKDNIDSNTEDNNSQSDFEVPISNSAPGLKITIKSTNLSFEGDNDADLVDIVKGSADDEVKISSKRPTINLREYDLVSINEHKNESEIVKNLEMNEEFGNSDYAGDEQHSSYDNSSSISDNQERRIPIISTETLEKLDAVKNESDVTSDRVKLPEITESTFIGDSMSPESDNTEEPVKQQRFTQIDSSSWSWNESDISDTSLSTTEKSNTYDKGFDILDNSSNDNDTNKENPDKHYEIHGELEDVWEFNQTKENQNASDLNRSTSVTQIDNTSDDRKTTEETVTYVTEKIGNHPLSAKLTDEERDVEFKEVGQSANNNEDRFCNLPLPTPCACEIDSSDDQYDWSSNSQRSDDCCCDE